MRLTKDVPEGSNSHRRMERNGHTEVVASKPYVGASLAQNGKAEILKRPHDLGAGNRAGQPHAAASTGSSTK